MEQLKNFKPFDLHDKLRLSDNDFDAWLEELGLLHGKRTCHKCGGRTTLRVNKGVRYGCWRCTTKNCRAQQGRKTFCWEKVCYHAAGFSSDDSSPAVHEVTNSTALHAPDKFFTQSSKGKTIIRNFCGHEFGKVYCSCGSGCQPQYQRSVEIYDSRFKGPGLTLISLNHNYKDSMSMSNVYVDPNPKIKYICQVNKY
uniref:Probable pectate lyase F n=1 Tax=Meloidogyne enterolobii TaxID=390850 RepID=A0A6V7XCJ1_MELEN|nr:unnamed protein product [Meloidogyne enterolobii]